MFVPKALQRRTVAPLYVPCLHNDAEGPCVTHVPLGYFGSSFVRCLCSSPFVCDCYQCVNNDVVSLQFVGSHLEGFAGRLEESICLQCDETFAALGNNATVHT
eukprot:s69_g25.t1